MNTLPILVLIGFISAVEGSAKLTAITDVSNEYVQELYQKLRNEEPPSDEDLANINARARQRVCEDIFSSGAFAGRAIDTSNLYEQLANKPELEHILDQMYGRKKSSFGIYVHAYEYTNAYKFRRFEVARMVNGHLEFYWARDFVFMCLARREHAHQDNIIPYYVSKEYNLSKGPLYTAGRFVFAMNFRLPEREFVKLAEEPATVFVKANFDIEMYYLELRNNRRQGEDLDRDDPVCRLISREPRKNHHYRICAKVLNAQYFEAQVRHQIREWRTACTSKPVSFGTRNASISAAGKLYTERMIPCFYANPAGHPRTIYISRAYRSREVFVYSRDIFDDKIYLRNLCINLDFIREPIFLNLDDVE